MWTTPRGWWTTPIRITAMKGKLVGWVSKGIYKVGWLFFISFVCHIYQPGFVGAWWELDPCSEVMVSLVWARISSSTLTQSSSRTRRRSRHVDVFGQLAENTRVSEWYGSRWEMLILNVAKELRICPSVCLYKSYCMFFRNNLWCIWAMFRLTQAFG